MRHDDARLGRIRVQPPLNTAERDHLSGLAAATGTLRGTVTGRGASDVPFARLAWEACDDGCCLTWSPGTGSPAMMLATLRFLVEHLLRPGARAEGLAGFDRFTFDHVLDGVFIGGGRIVEVSGNAATERLVDPPCSRSTPMRESRPVKLPANVVVLRPHRA